MNRDHGFKNATADELSHNVLAQAPAKIESTDPKNGIEHRLYHLGKDIYAHTQTPVEESLAEEEVTKIGELSAEVPWPGVEAVKERYQELYSENENVKATGDINWEEVARFESMLELYCTLSPSMLNQVCFRDQIWYINAERLGIYGGELEKHPEDGETKKAIWDVVCGFSDLEQPNHLKSPHYPVEIEFDSVYEWELRAGLLVEFGAFKWADKTAKTVALHEKGLKQTEIAEELDIDQSTVSKNLTRAKNILTRVHWTSNNKPDIE